jgi:hypothetical protein
MRRSRSQGPCVGALRLFGEIRALRYASSRNLLYRYITQAGSKATALIPPTVSTGSAVLV